MGQQQNEAASPIVSDSEIITRLREDLDTAEQELRDAKRVIALLVLDAGGKVALGRDKILEVSDETIIETTQDVVNGGWVIRAKAPARG